MPGNLHPRPNEVRSQLSKILSSRYFKHSDVQSKLLSLAVEYTLSDLPITQQDLNGVDGTNYSPDSNKGRQNLLLMRRKVLEYYKAEGADDPIIITPPLGRTYKTTFCYHSNAEPLRILKRSIELKRQMRASELAEASALLATIRASGSIQLQALIESSETALLGHLVGRSCGSAWRESDVLKALRYANKALKLDECCARAYLMAGVAYSIRFEFGSADRVFDYAIAQFGEEITQSLWYATYLLFTARVDHAISITAARFKANPDCAESAILHAFALYLARKPGEVADVLLTIVPTPGMARYRDTISGLAALEAVS